MVFKKLMRAFGVGGPGVDTVLHRADTQPGRTLTGTVEITGGDHDVVIQEVVLSLVTRAEVEMGDAEGGAVVEFARSVVSGEFGLAAGEERRIDFELPVPWETPVTMFYGKPLRGMAVGVRTELAVAKAVDKGDLDPVNVHPLGCQEAVLEAFEGLGFQFRSADLEHGRIHGVAQQLPFYQEIEYIAPSQYRGRVGEVELTFVADPREIEVVLEADGRSGGDAFGRFRMSHEEAESADWPSLVGGWVSELADRIPHQSHHGGHHGGMGGVVAGAAAGVVGGMVLGEVFDEVGEELFGEE
ncbi:sporulation-control protein [Stackebrandtia albiflava]|uniref:Sporulation-control protein n=1 Tax=Stackebrandtia albiflava TaxID=406432 RepID=A0A562VDZ1_9ACTN|nr:sporulation protein [Stackebrandtia albiflava]TWJ16106.1 sporulation-control protein [Stackebrandtia albiflava]